MPYILMTPLTISIMAVDDWALSDGSSIIPTIIPKGELAVNAGALRKEGLKSKTEQPVQGSGSDLIAETFMPSAIYTVAAFKKISTEIRNAF